MTTDLQFLIMCITFLKWETPMDTSPQSRSQTTSHLSFLAQVAYEITKISAYDARILFATEVGLSPSVAKVISQPTEDLDSSKNIPGIRWI
jgi:hypothetical protein